MDFSLGTADLGLVATTTGGCVWRFFAKRGGTDVPLFREPRAGSGRAALQSACFPLVPFGNRVRDNRFTVDGHPYELTPNMPWDRHHLHGDGWTGEWYAIQQAPGSLTLRFDHRQPNAPYTYSAEQSFVLDGRTLVLTLTVLNEGDGPMPFGLGWHPYFPLTPQTLLRASTEHFWDEDDAWLPTVRRPTGGDLDFEAGARLPRRWVNTQFEAWDGEATIMWPEHELALAIDADPLFDRCLLFVSDPAFDAGYDFDFFCFEPMSHSIDDHNRPDGGGLRRLAPGERLTGSVRFTLADRVQHGRHA
jgi:aldose 1-epimerase